MVNGKSQQKSNVLTKAIKKLKNINPIGVEFQ